MICTYKYITMYHTCTSTWVRILILKKENNLRQAHGYFPFLPVSELLPKCALRKYLHHIIIDSYHVLLQKYDPISVEVSSRLRDSSYALVSYVSYVQVQYNK